MVFDGVVVLAEQTSTHGVLEAGKQTLSDGANPSLPDRFRTIGFHASFHGWICTYFSYSRAETH